jgi:hypothetical protein
MDAGLTAAMVEKEKGELSDRSENERDNHPKAPEGEQQQRREGDTRHVKASSPEGEQQQRQDGGNKHQKASPEVPSLPTVVEETGLPKPLRKWFIENAGLGGKKLEKAVCFEMLL